MLQLINIARKLPRTNNKFINFAHKVALFSIAVGNIALLVSLSILNGFDTKLSDTARKFTSDICVQTINGSEIIDVDSKVQYLGNISEIKTITPVVQTEGIVSTRSFTEGVVLQSVYDQPRAAIPGGTGCVARSCATAFCSGFKWEVPIKDNIIAGDLNFNKDSNEIIISQLLANKLQVKLGDKLLLYAIKGGHLSHTSSSLKPLQGSAPHSSGSPRLSFSSATYSSFKIKAIYNTGMQQYDNSVIFMPFKQLSDFLEIGDNTATYLEVTAEDLDAVSAIALQIDSLLGFPIFSVTYYDINRSLFAWIELQKEPIPLVLAIISIVASMNIITMLIITIVEKSGSIGILRTLGLGRRAIVLIFTQISLRVALIGTVLGVGLSVLFAFLQTNYNFIKLDSKIYYVDSLPVDLEWQFVVIVSSISIVLSLISAIIPSVIAAQISPIKTIRFK